ncbi:hypothetical protein BX666DRAFT_2026369 [Dichotomocladium elegans]|nr:hypothetical protein BX666DRAFT_2026369 [Dichotomocladium elegans]
MTVISPKGYSFVYSPAIHSDAHVQGWKKLVDAVHAKSAVIYLHLWHVERGTGVGLANGHPPGAALNHVIGTSFEVPHALTVDEIENHVKAAQNADESRI